jgi:aspartate kinase
MKVLKFGGASTNNIERIHILSDIIASEKGEKRLVVISAMGKTTNALEKVVEAFFSGHPEEALRLFRLIRESHLTTAKYLLVRNYLATEAKLGEFFTEVEWLLHEKPKKGFDYYYDQVVCIGELLSTTIISAWLEQEGLANKWVDVRDLFRTDNNFRDASVDWDFTQQKVVHEFSGLLASHNLIVTQGFIGSTDENESTTLGREGSDFSAALFANMLEAESLTIWKDVRGVMNADPKVFKDAILINELNYDEVIEMAYYGAQVIHPKTIKPLQNKGIPLYVKCFLDKDLPGTVIHDKPVHGLPPIIVFKHNQVLMHLHSKDFSFVGEQPTAELYQLFSKIKVKPNLLQSGAVTLQVCLDDRSDKIEWLASAASDMFDVQIEKGLTLLTIRHYHPSILKELTNGRQIVLKQQSPETVQVLLKQIN